ncbi:hypothetical protein ABI59_17585 [Acidobacteria bacterium Mor1]|nr:hypothetical protein ABI59_17585 [Acidobacteria bacterium Mor1]
MAKVLLVDDEPDVFKELVGDWCNSRFYEFKHVETFKAAGVLDQAADADIVVVDHAFDGEKTTGLDFLSNDLRLERRSDQAILMVSQHMGRTLHQKAKRAGADGALERDLPRRDLFEYLDKTHAALIARRDSDPVAVRELFARVKQEHRAAIQSLELDDGAALCDKLVFVASPFPETVDERLEQLLQTVAGAFAGHAIPIVASSPGATPETIFSKVQNHIRLCSGVIALFGEREKDPNGAFNPNVALEAGFAIGLEKSLLFIMDMESPLRFSDIAGVEVLHSRQLSGEELESRIVAWSREWSTAAQRRRWVGA